MYLFLILSLGCTTKCATDRAPSRDAEVGLASYYSSSLHGRRTASGDVYDENKMTAAHRTLPFGTRVRVVNLNNQKSVVVTINDRGPFVGNRIIDVSRMAARELGFIREGVVRVRVELLAD